MLHPLTSNNNPPFQLYLKNKIIPSSISHLQLMITYLTKIEGNNTHHFRATINRNGVDVVQGVCYHWLSKYWEGFDSKAQAITRQQQLITEKLNEGFTVTSFKKLPEIQLTFTIKQNGILRVSFLQISTIIKPMFTLVCF